MSELSEALKSCGALQFGEFTLASGAKSDYYIDIKKASTNPEVLRLIARLMAQKMRDEGIEADRIAGVVLGSVPLATALALETGIPYVIRVLVVEDVITTAGSSIKAIGTLREAGAEVRHVISVIDREGGGAENLAEAGVDFRPLVKASELVKR